MSETWEWVLSRSMISTIRSTCGSWRSTNSRTHWANRLRLTVYEYAAYLRTGLPPPWSDPWPGGRRGCGTARATSPRRLSWLLLRPEEELSAGEREYSGRTVGTAVSRRWADAGQGGGGDRPIGGLQQRADGGAGDEAQAHQAADVRPGHLRSAQDAGAEGSIEQGENGDPNPIAQEPLRSPKARRSQGRRQKPHRGPGQSQTAGLARLAQLSPTRVD